MRGEFTIGSLFAGIGGLELGLERGLKLGGVDARTIWQCEIEPFARSILARHWPSAIRYHDITEMQEVPYVDLVCGGFPCQDLSYAGKRAGLAGARSGLFWELMRVVRLVGPRYVVLENVAALLTADGGLAMGAVLGALAEGGYDAEWDCIPASAIGAPHHRDRVFVVAYADEAQCKRRSRWLEASPFKPEASFSHFEAAAFGGPRLVPWVGRFEAPPACLGVAHGVPTRLDRDRIGALGNAVVPQVAEVIGRRVAEIESTHAP